jgi:hypothetical protein
MNTSSLIIKKQNYLFDDIGYFIHNECSLERNGINEVLDHNVVLIY